MVRGNRKLSLGEDSAVSRPLESPTPKEVIGCVGNALHQDPEDEVDPCQCTS